VGNITLRVAHATHDMNQQVAARIWGRRGFARCWDKKSHSNIMTACAILQNMIIEDVRNLDLKFFSDNEDLMEHYWRQYVGEINSQFIHFVRFVQCVIITILCIPNFSLFVLLKLL
jgi:hypothetical protein